MSIEPVQKEIVVKATLAHAFRVFTAGMDRWWPRGHHVGKSPMRSMLVEPRVGGRWYAVSEDASENVIGKVLVWEPPHRLVLAWQLTAAWVYDPELVTELEVTFASEGAKVTRVRLEHRNLDRFGETAEKLRKAIAAPEGWAGMMEQFGKIAEMPPAPKYVLFYELAPGGLALARAHFAAHAARVAEFHQRGTLLMSGPFADPSQGALGVFTTQAAADEFAAGDPFVTHGAVGKHEVRTWNDVLGVGFITWL